MVCFQQQGCQPLETPELLGLSVRALPPLPPLPVVVSGVAAPGTCIPSRWWTLDFQKQGSKQIVKLVGTVANKKEKMAVPPKTLLWAF